MPELHRLSMLLPVMQADKANGAASHHGDHSDDSGSESSDDEADDKDKVRVRASFHHQVESVTSGLVGEAQTSCWLKRPLQQPKHWQ